GRRQDDQPRLARRVELQSPVRVLIGALDDLAGQRQRIVRIVAAPAVMRPGRAAGQQKGTGGTGEHTSLAHGDLLQSSAAALRWRYSSSEMRGISNRSVVRAYQPVPCMRPISRDRKS